MPTCVACSKFCQPKQLHQFTSKPHLRDLWLTALTKDDAEKARLDILLKTSSQRQFVCIDHFSDEAYDVTPHSRVLKANAVPMSKRAKPTVIYRTPTSTVSHSPPPTPSSSHLLLPSTPVARPLFSRPPPLPSFRLADASIPPCCRCCCKQETPTEMKKDANWIPPPPITDNLPESKYLIVSKESLVRLLKRCNSCSSGQNTLQFTENAHALTCKCTCTSCGVVFNWSNSDTLKTANASPKEQLKEVNVDMCVGSAVTAVGTARLNYFLKAVGLNTVSTRTFHRHKNDYLLPAVTHVFTKCQEDVFARLKDRLDKGEKLQVAGDGSFDTRGYSAEWCRYFLVDATTGEALVYVLMNKKETGSSGTLEVACLERALDILAQKIGGVHNISILVTDRHSSVIKMMKAKYPSIDHFFDPWHFYRNLTLNLLKITKCSYMAQVKHTWTRTLINKAYDAVVRAQGDGVLASEMFRSALLCSSGIHDFSRDASFTKFKRCLHAPPPPNFPYLQKDGRAYKRLQSIIFTDKNIEDIKSVSWLLKTSTCESLNSIAWRYAPKEMYFDRKGHELRSMMAILHWNELKKDEIDGTRIITGKKGHYNNTLKKNIYRNVKSPARNEWRSAVKTACYEVYWNKLNTPIVSHPSDTNLEESEDEDELPSSSAADGDALQQEIRLLLEEDEIEEQENELDSDVE